MEATTAAEGLLDQIRPPRLEDAGLEDCALPPDSIKEAFLKAAIAVGSRAASIFEKDEGRCVEDPWGEETGDDLVGVIEGVDPPPGACVPEKGGVVGETEERGDKLVAPGLTEAEERGDKVVEGGDPVEGGEACVDGLKGLEIGDKGKSGGEEEEGERPILGETFVKQYLQNIEASLKWHQCLVLERLSNFLFQNELIN
ncbi:hypothetical protein RHGRI_035239 [Rhododendron griersonianum]|uniref:Uncharacterized protein n=1 Tax=Rhododendron griersonianum TaxID=479676 RepID=A0AAV6I6Y9_9ERIC|nr:hypothetical protein RHGRI_035239 [Rhododendron griersonianum]